MKIKGYIHKGSGLAGVAGPGEMKGIILLMSLMGGDNFIFSLKEEDGKGGWKLASPKTYKLFSQMRKQLGV